MLKSGGVDDDSFTFTAPELILELRHLRQLRFAIRTTGILGAYDERPDGLAFEQVSTAPRATFRTAVRSS